MDTHTEMLYLLAAHRLADYHFRQQDARNRAAWDAMARAHYGSMILARVARDRAAEHDANARDAWADRDALVAAVEAAR